MSGLFQFLEITTQIDEQLIRLLEENAIGTPGLSMVYRHSDVRKKVARVPGAIFANLSVKGRLYGTICFSRRQIYTMGHRHDAFYLRYFTFKDSFRVAHPGKRQNRNSKIRKEVTRLMRGEGLPAAGGVLYAYVDPGNVRSVSLIEEFGFQKVGNFNVLLLNRLWPTKDKHVKKAPKSMTSQIKTILKDQAKNQKFASISQIEIRDDYFVITSNQQILCGVQAVADCWEVIDLPGWSGKFIIKIMSKIPLLNRLFHPNYKFVFLENIICEPGSESLLHRLFESVLCHYQVYTGIMCLDPRTRLYASIKRHVRMGWVHLLQGEKQIDVVAKSADSTRLYPDAPTFVSAVDVL